MKFSEISNGQVVEHSQLYYTELRGLKTKVSLYEGGGRTATVNRDTGEVHFDSKSKYGKDDPHRGKTMKFDDVESLFEFLWDDFLSAFVDVMG